MGTNKKSNCSQELNNPAFRKDLSELLQAIERAQKSNNYALLMQLKRMADFIMCARENNICLDNIVHVGSEFDAVIDFGDGYEEASFKLVPLLDQTVECETEVTIDSAIGLSLYGKTVDEGFEYVLPRGQGLIVRGKVISINNNHTKEKIR